MSLGRRGDCQNLGGELALIARRTEQTWRVWALPLDAEPLDAHVQVTTGTCITRVALCTARITVPFHSIPDNLTLIRRTIIGMDTDFSHQRLLRIGRRVLTKLSNSLSRPGCTEEFIPRGGRPHWATKQLSPHRKCAAPPGPFRMRGPDL